MIEVEAIGGFFPLDAQGYVINPTDELLIPVSWRPVLHTFYAIYQQHFGLGLRSMWVRGSLARGAMQAGWSDVDVFALVNQDTAVRWKRLILTTEEQKQLSKLLPPGFEQVQWEMMYSTFNVYEMAAMPKMAMLIQTQSLCWWGEDIRDQLPRYRPGKAMALNYRWLAADWELYQREVYTTKEDRQGFLKTLIRTAFELVMARAGKYTPDLYWCVDSFAQYYPKRGMTLKKILNLYGQPLKEEYQLTALLEEITPWILSESKRQLS